PERSRPHAEISVAAEVTGKPAAQIRTHDDAQLRRDVEGLHVPATARQCSAWRQRATRPLAQQRPKLVEHIATHQRTEPPVAHALEARMKFSGRAHPLPVNRPSLPALPCGEESFFRIPNGSPRQSASRECRL